MHEGTELALEVLPIESGELAPRYGHGPLREVLVDVAVLLQRVVVADDPDAVAGADLAVRLELLDAALSLVAEGLGVVREFILIPEHARGEPQVADRDLVEQALETTDVVIVEVRRAEDGEIGLAVALRQRGDELVDDGDARVVVLLGVRDVVDVDLHDRVVVDDDSDAVAAADGGEHDAAIRERESHHQKTWLYEDVATCRKDGRSRGRTDANRAEGLCERPRRRPRGHCPDLLTLARNGRRCPGVLARMGCFRGSRSHNPRGSDRWLKSENPRGMQGFLEWS